jgi:hypothetical protein
MGIQNYEMEIISKNSIVDIDLLKFNKEYQRAIDSRKKKRIFDSINANGYWPQEIVTVNHLMEIIDGQHRVIVAKEIGIKKIPVVIVKFPTLQQETMFFADKNNWNTSLKPVDFWHSRYLAEHPYALLIYRLNSDSESLLCSRIAVKGHATKKSKFTISNVLHMTNAAIGVSHPWTKGRDNKLCDAIDSMPYQLIREYINTFLNFFYGSFGEDKRSNAIAYRGSSIRSIVIFYILAYKQGLILSPSTMAKFIKKMSFYIFTSDFIKTEHSGRIQGLVNHFNSKRKKNRIVYSVQ